MRVRVIFFVFFVSEKKKKIVFFVRVRVIFFVFFVSEKKKNCVLC